MKILFIAPLPPPVSGHSLAAKVFYDELIKRHEVDVVDLRKDSFKDGVISLQRVLDIIRILKEIHRKKQDTEIIYFTISESLAGNIKDLFIYLVCVRSLPKMIIHLHGGSIKKLLFDKYKLLYKINRYFIRRVGGAIVLGNSHINIFSGITSPGKIHVVPNFAEDALFIDKNKIVEKFSNPMPLKILFLSNLIYSKGPNELANAFLALDDHSKKMVSIDYAGCFESEVQKSEFIAKIKGQSQIQYHGVVQGIEKKNLLSNAHIFCLPTTLLEGQPISILEAYAAGCVVITTNQGGICDIFSDNVNGFEVEKSSAPSITKVIEEILHNPPQLFPMAIRNRELAEAKYKTSKYNGRLMKIIEMTAAAC